MSTTTTRQQNSIQARLLRRIKKHSGMEDGQIIEAGNHGADAGWPGFTYTSDTAAFFKANRADIKALVEEMASDMGETPLDMVAGFRYLAGCELRRTHTGYMDDRAEAINRAHKAEYYPSISRCLYGGRLTDEDNDVANALAWFALEEVGRWLESERDNN
jgi:hypothetical protein